MMRPIRLSGIDLRRWAGLLSLIAALAAGSPALAQVDLIFYGHQLTVAGEKRTYLPHAMIGLKGAASDGSPPIYDYYEFTPAVPPVSLLPIDTPGRLVIGHGKPDSNEYFEVALSDATFHKIEAMVAYWRSPKGSTYNLWSRNCVHFVAEAAKAAGLDVPGGMRTEPAKFLAELKLRNAERAVAPPTEAAAGAAAAAAGKSH